MNTSQTQDKTLPSVLAIPEFRRFLIIIAISTLASTALAVVLGYQIYEIARKPIALGWLGLAEAIPALSLALYGGHIADRMDRRTIVLVTQNVSILCALLYAYLSSGSHPPVLFTLYAVVFLAGIARGFSGPALSAFEGQIVPQELLLRASGYLSASWQVSAILGPMAGGFIYSYLGARNTYLVIAALLTVGMLLLFTISPKPVVRTDAENDVPQESVFESIRIGVRYVFHNPALVGSMALDLFAVLFGGAIALLPVFAKDILHVGPSGFGLLNAATSIGALTATATATLYPPLRHAGRNLLLCVAAFGVSIIVFALSKNMWLSFAALFLSGVFDGVSMVIRRAILRLLSPNHLRGRIAAVSMIFIGSSNEIGAFESGITATALGTVRSVWMGAVVTLMIVAGTAYFAPGLRALRLDTTPSTPPDDSDH